MRKIISNSRGNSLLSVMMSAALGIFVVSGLASVIVNITKSANGYKNSQDVETTASLLRQAFQNVDICRETLFRDATGNSISRALPSASSPLSITSIKARSNGDVSNLFSVEPDDDLGNVPKIIKMELVSIDKDDSLSVVSERSVNGEVVVTFKKPGFFPNGASVAGSKNRLSQPLVEKTIPLSFRVNKFNQIVDCIKDPRGVNTNRAIAGLGSCPPGQIARGVRADSTLECVGATVPQPVVEVVYDSAPQTWTYQGVAFVTTCPGYCDAMERLVCTGKKCPRKPPSMCYCVYPVGCKEPGFKTTQRPEFLGTPFCI